MARELIKIHIAQLRAGTPLAREIFLRMPRNGKMLRIAWRSDEISPELLACLLDTPRAELYAQPLDGDGDEAASLPLFGDLAKIKPAHDEAGGDLDPALAAIKPVRASKADDVTAALPAELEEIRPAATTTQEGEQSPEREDSFVSEDFAPVDHDSEEEEGLLARRRREAGEALEEKRARKEEFGEEGPFQRKLRAVNDDFDGGDSEDAADESATSFETASEEARKPLSAELVTEDTLGFSVDDEERTKEIMIPDSAIQEPITTVAGRLATVAETFSSKADHAREQEVRLGALLNETAEELFQFSQSPGEETRAALERKLEACREEISRQRSEGAEPTDILAVLNDSLGRVTDALSGVNPADAEAPDFATLSGHFTEFAEEFHTTVAKEERLAAAALGRELRSVAEVFTAFASGDTGGEEALADLRERITGCLDDTETRIAASGEDDEKLYKIKASLAEALRALPYTSRAAKAYRDTPLIASRLAAQLAHSLGYASQAYLSDLALSTWIFFAEKNGAPIELADPPPLERLVRATAVASSDEQAGTPVGDVLTILSFLDRYFENPDCDRTRKEFVPRTFESTLRALESGTNPPDEWTAARWRYFVGKGLSMHAESLCAKASAKAAKTARGQAPRSAEKSA